MKGFSIYLAVVLLIALNAQLPAQKSHQEFSSDRVDYLIVTSEKLKADFEPLLNWKIRKGLKAELITMEEINSRYEESTVQLNIKSCLFDYYSNKELVWALLGGDQNVVPVQGCYAKVRMGTSDLVDESIPTDLFYACFDGRFDWNSNLNDKIGERFLDGLNLVPNIYVSRIPVKEPEEVRTFVKKTLDYELNPPLEGFLERMLLSGVRSYLSWDGKSDNHHRSEVIDNQYISPNWSEEATMFFDTGTDFPTGEWYHMDVANFSEQINSGYGIIHYAGPGNSTAIKMEFGRGFDTSDAAKLDHPVSGLMLSTSSLVNAFELEDTCLSEAFLKNPDGGAVAFFGNTRYAFGNQDTSLALGPSMSYSAVFMENLVSAKSENRDYSFAAIASHTKSEFINNGGSGGSYHYLLYTMNAMGDPELPIYATAPGVFDQVRIYWFGSTLRINTGGVDDCRICLTSSSLSDEFQEVVEGVSEYSFDQLPNDFYVTITKPGYVPYCFNSEGITGVDAPLGSRVRLYPNPFADYLHVEVFDRRSGMELYDLQGRRVLSGELQQGVNRFDLSGYPAGSYMLNLKGGGASSWHKVIKGQ